MQDQSEATPDEADATVDGTDQGQPDTGADDLTAQLEKWKSLARKHEAKAKANAEAVKRLQSVEERAALAEAKIADLTLTGLRTSIAAEFGGIPADALTGDDEEALRASAAKVLAWVEGQRKPAPKPSQLRSGTQGLTPATAPGERTTNALRSMFGS